MKRGVGRTGHAGEANQMQGGTAERVALDDPKLIRWPWPKVAVSRAPLALLRAVTNIGLKLQV